MSTSEKDKITDYSADYRGIHAPKPKEKSRKAAQEKPNRPAGSSKKTQPRPAENESKAQARSGQKKEPKRSLPLPEEPVDRLENDSEIDDFLPVEDHDDSEQILTKWDDGSADSKPEKVSTKRSGKYRYGIFVGSVVLLFALVGVVFIASAIGTRIHSALTDDSKLRAYDKFLAVAVAQDPQPFASPDKADPDFVLNASIWKTMTENGSNYTSYDDAGRTIVPLGDVADACRDLFGPDCSLQPKNPAMETFYTYDAGKSQFHVSLYSLEGTYEPYTVKIGRDGDATVLRVGYVSPSDQTRKSSGVSSAGGKPNPTKYMEYLLKTNSSTKKEYIYAVRKAAG